MATNYVQAGGALTLIAPYAVASGAGFQVGRIFAVAADAAANAATVVGYTEGVFTLAKTDEQAWTAGQAIYWDDTNKECTTSGAAGKLPVGVATEAVAATAGLITGKVRLNGSFPQQAAFVANAAGADVAAAMAQIDELRDALVAAGFMAAS